MTAPQWIAAKGSKMRNKPVWECRNCGDTLETKPWNHCRCGAGGADRIYHQSQKEFKRWHELKALEKAGQIRGLVRQRRIPLTIAGEPVLTPKGRPMVYTADFNYWENCYETSIYERRAGAPEFAGEEVCEDVKGRKSGNAYDLFHLKREILRHMGHEIRET